MKLFLSERRQSPDPDSDPYYDKCRILIRIKTNADTYVIIQNTHIPAFNLSDSIQKAMFQIFSNINREKICILTQRKGANSGPDPVRRKSTNLEASMLIKT